MPEERVQSRRAAWAALLGLMLGFAALFAAYYPPLSGIEDEVGFVNQALVWSRGAVSLEGAGLSPEAADRMNFTMAKGRHVAMRHPGRSALAVPFLMMGGVRATFASGLILHLATTALAGFVLARLGRSPLWAALVLFHPTLAIYSRTIMADEGAGAGLLLAGLALTYGGPGAAIGAGLAVALAASMRYHAALALPFVAAAFLLPPRRPGGRWDALRCLALCLIAGGAGGGLILAYNLAIYGTPMDPFSATRGFFSPAAIAEQAPYYGTALLMFWPGMLIAPALDRSTIRWMVRGAGSAFFLFFSCYYFHDKTTEWVETLIVGLRLFQVVLPTWIVSYAGVVDDRVAGPSRLRVGGRARAVAVGVACAGLLGATGLMFSRHQQHLETLRSARTAAAAAVPDGSLIVANGEISKLFGIPEGGPSYRWLQLDYQGQTLDHSHQLDREERPWYVAWMAKGDADRPPESMRTLVQEYDMTRVPTAEPLLTLYVARPRPVRSD